MIYNVYWKDENMNRHNGFCKARSRDEAYDITAKLLQKGCVITAVYEANENSITPQSLTINFANTTDYDLF